MLNIGRLILSVTRQHVGILDAFCVDDISLLYFFVCICMYVFGTTAPSGRGPPNSRGF